MFRKLAFFSFLTLATSFSSAQLPASAQADSVVIVGGGVGALTSAIYLARSGFHPIVIEGKNPGGALSLSPKVQNWPGEVEISGADLMEKIHRQAEKNGVLFLQHEVMEVDFSSRPFKILTKDLIHPDKTKAILATSVILATGSEPSRLHVQGEGDFWLNGVYACAVCDGALYKDKVVAVIGGGDAALSDAQYLSHIAKKVYVVVRKNALKVTEKLRERTLSNTPNVEFLFGAQVKEIKGNKKGVSQLSMIKDSQEMSIPADAIFLAIGSTPNTQMFSSQLSLSDTGHVRVNEHFETSIAGVYAIGDIVDPIYKQAISAAGDGAKAALEVSQYLNAVGSSSLREGEMASAEPIRDSSQGPSFPAPSHVIEVKSYEQLVLEIQSAGMPVLIDFYASWCSPCRHLKPVLESYAKSLQGKVKILKIDVHSCKDLANIYSIRSMPSLIVLDKMGEQKDRIVGAPEIMGYLSTLR